MLELGAWPRVRYYGATEIPSDDVLYLYTSDTTGISLISDQLTGSDNYRMRSREILDVLLVSREILDVLLVKNKLCFIYGTCSHDSVTELIQSRCDLCNDVVTVWLINSVVMILIHGKFVKNQRDRICTYYRKKGHRVDKCWKKHGVTEEVQKCWNVSGNIVVGSEVDIDIRIVHSPQM